jgi:uncharacterized protein (DUF1778 family)
VARAKADTAPVTLRMRAEIKEAAEKAAKREHRNFTNFVENLILQHCRSKGIDVPNFTEESI